MKIKNRVLISFILSCVFVFPACEIDTSESIQNAYSSVNQAIINGTPVTDDSEQAAVPIIREWSKTDASGLSSGGASIFCTGTLITPDWVLTAGHCIKPCIQKNGSIDESKDYEKFIADGEVSITVANNMYGSGWLSNKIN